MPYMLLGILESPSSFFLVYLYDTTCYNVLLQCERKYFLNVTFFFLLSHNTEKDTFNMSLFFMAM